MVSFLAPTIRSLEASPATTAVFFCFDEICPLQGIVSLVDWRLHGHLSRMKIEGFFTGRRNIPLLMMPGRRLAVQYLLLIGLGPRDSFDAQVFREAVSESLEIHRGLRVDTPAMMLPGRIEALMQPEDAMENLIAAYEPYLESARHLFLIEPPAAQKQMTPALERWRLRRLIPGFGVA